MCIAYALTLDLRPDDLASTSSNLLNSMRLQLHAASISSIIGSTLSNEVHI